MSKTVLIYTASTGAGHDQAAQALQEQLLCKGFDVKIVNPIKSSSKFNERLIQNGYGIMANYFPKVYGSLYRISDFKYPNKNLSKWLALALENHIAGEIAAIKPDVIVSTHAFYVKILASIKKSGRTDASLISVVTDLGVHRFYVHPNVDAYITGSEMTNQKLKNFGVADHKIFNFGIPVKSDFYKDFHTPRQTLTKNKPLSLLIMGGSMGSYKIIPIIEQLYLLNHSVKATVICGNNEKLKNHLNTVFSNRKGNVDIEIIGFTNHVKDYMAEADLLISKPGGLTLTEAIYSELPILIPFYINGQEAENAEILNSLGIALKVKKPKEINHLIETMLYDDTVLERLRYNIRHVASNYSIDKTADLCEALGTH